MAYAKLLTRDYLEYLGITDVTPDGKHIFKGNKELVQQYDGHYMLVNLYDPLRRQQVAPELRDSGTGQFAMSVQRIVYCWYNKVIPEGLVIDHIDDNKLNNNINNLRILTPAENIKKGRPVSDKEMICKLNKPRSHYEDKLTMYTNLYEEAKKIGDQKAAHKWRTYISNYRARLRYYDNNRESE